MIRLRRVIPTAALVGLMVGVCPTAAQVPPQSMQFEVLAGFYEPSPPFLDADLLYGIRFGFNTGAHLMFELELAFQSSDSQVVEMGVPGRIDYEAMLLDLSVGWTFAPRKKVNGMIYGGVGYANVDASVEAGEASISGLFDDSVTVNLGAGLRIGITKGSYLRFDVRGRWFNSRDDDEVDGDATVAYGWYF